MTSMSKWQDQFRKRCLAVGWDVEMTTSGHYKVRSADGRFLFTFPSTPGDKRSMLNTLADAKRLGLEDLEARAKLLAERERLERIESDRAAAEKKIDAANGNAAAAAKSKEPSDLGEIDGVAIVMSGPAMFKSPVMAFSAPISGGEELLLADDRTVFRCVRDAATNYRPDAPGLCHKIYTSVNSLKTHIAYHSRKPKVVDEESVAENPSAGKIVPASVQAADAPSRPADTLKPTAKLAGKVAILSDIVDEMIGKLRDVTLDLSSIQHDIARLEVADEATIEKARQFDVLQGIFAKGK